MLLDALGWSVDANAPEAVLLDELGWSVDANPPEAGIVLSSAAIPMTLPSTVRP